MSSREKDSYTVILVEDGPLQVWGEVTIRRMTVKPQDNHYVYVDEGVVAQGSAFCLCRCGLSKTPPFCDGAHKPAGFDGTETASRVPYAERAKKYRGGAMTLLDDYDMCALARFCHTEEGTIWDLMKHADDPEAAALIAQAANECPAGRLVLLDNATGEEVVRESPNEIVILSDPEMRCSGPLWLRGKFTLVGAEGQAYEKHGQYTLCRCGLSANKPLCDSEHAFSHWVESTGS